MSTDNPGGGDPVRPYSPLPPGAPAWHSADYYGRPDGTLAPTMREWATRPIAAAEEATERLLHDRRMLDEHKKDKRAALIAASNVHSTLPMSDDEVIPLAEKYLEWLNGR